MAADRLVDALAARPTDEPQWEWLRRASDVAYFDDPLRPAPTIRSIRPGGSSFIVRQRLSSAARSPSSVNTIGAATPPR